MLLFFLLVYTLHYLFLCLITIKTRSQKTKCDLSVTLCGVLKEEEPFSVEKKKQRDSSLCISETEVELYHIPTEDFSNSLKMNTIILCLFVLMPQLLLRGRCRPSEKICPYE